MRRMRVAARGGALALLAALSLGAAGGAVTLDPQSYYLFPVGDPGVGVQTLSASAAAQGFAVLAFSGNTVTVMHGTGSPADTVGTMLASAARLLVVDGDRYYLRVAEPTLSYALRPAESGLELVVSPKVATDMFDALTAILVDLQDVGIMNIDVDLSSFRPIARNPFKGPAAPQDLAAKLDYTLYGLVVAEDWFIHAAQKGLALLGLKLEVVVEKIPGASLPAEFSVDVLSQTEALASLVVPVDRIVALARSAGVGHVRLPYVPVAP